MPTQQHEDFGAKIGGAKKDLWKVRGLMVDDLGEMNEREAEKYVKKDNVWKKPDYQAMVDGGTPIGVVYFIKKVRDSLNTSPRYQYSDNTAKKQLARRTEYIETVRQLQKVMKNVHTVEDAMRAYDRFLLDNGYVQKSEGYSGVNHYFVSDKGRKNTVITNGLVETLHIYSERWFERAFTERAKADQFCVPKEQKVPVGYELRYYDGKNSYSQKDDWIPGTYYVTKGYSILQTNFENREAALKWAQEHARQRSKSGKTRFIPKQLEKVERTGPDFLGGHDVVGQDYLDTFGFRGGEYGNWMNQNDRQASLNMGFEALKDLASALQISDKDVTFQGSLAIAFGARGSGNAAAHYEPMRTVINLTKMHGAGSLAHEWWHALDDYMGKRYGAREFLSENPRPFPLFAKLIATIKYKPETTEQAAKRMQAQNENTRRGAEYCLDSAVHYYIKNYGDERSQEKYAALKTAFLSGEFGTVRKICELKKEVYGHVVPKSDREALERYERVLHAMREPQTPTIGRTETDYYRNSRKMGNQYEKDGGYWDSNVEMTARAFACYVLDKLPYTSDYLVGHAESAVAPVVRKDGSVETLKAYPEGEERRAINAVFDEIVADLKLQKVFTHEDVTLPLQASSREAGQLSRFDKKPSVIGQLAASKIADPKAPVQMAVKKPTEPSI